MNQKQHRISLKWLEQFFNASTVTPPSRTITLFRFFLFRAELRQIEEIVSAIFHTLLYHRSVGKFKYQRQEGRASSYSVGVVGAADVDCDFIDYTYVRADSQVEF